FPWCRRSRASGGLQVQELRPSSPRSLNWCAERYVRYTDEMARTHKKVGYSPTGKLEDVTPDMAARGIEAAFQMLEGRWKMVIIFHLFARGTLRFSELEKAIPG